MHALTGAYSLDAIEGRQLARFERHLRRCRDCTDEVRGFTATAAMLGLAVATPPPAELASGDRVGVTVEPAGGTSRPPTTPIVVLTVPA